MLDSTESKKQNREGRVTLCAEPGQKGVIARLLDTISLGALLKQMKGNLPEWVESARLHFTGGGLHIQLNSNRLIEPPEIARLKISLRKVLNYPAAIKLICKCPQGELPEDNSTTEYLFLISGNIQSPLVKDFEHQEIQLEAWEKEQEDHRIRIRKRRSRKKKNRNNNKINYEALKNEMEELLPGGVRMWKMSLYQMQQGKNALQFSIVRLTVPDDQELAVHEWRSVLEQSFKLGIIIQRERVSNGIEKQLTLIAGKGGLIRDTRKADKLINGIFGPLPEDGINYESIGRREIAAPLEDLTDIPFITIDPAGARDLDDALWATKLGGGRYRMLIAFADVTSAVLPDTPLDAYARKVAFSLYGRYSSIPLLGETLGFNKLSLHPGKERSCWVVEVEVDSAGRILNRRFSHAIVKSHIRLSFEDMQVRSQYNDELAEIIEALQGAAHSLRGKRLERAGFIKFKSEGKSYIIVEESMLVAKAVIAKFFEEAGIPILYKVHAPPGRIQRKHFMKELKEHGLRASSKDFTNPIRFRELLSKLKDDNLMGLASRILDNYLKRARYDVENKGHHGLGLDAYTEIKGLRNYVGVLNQRQAQHMLNGGPEVPINFLKREQRYVNRKHRIYHDNVIRLITFEGLREKLQDAGNLFAGRIAEIYPEGLLIDIPGFRGQGLLPRKRISEELLHKDQMRPGGFIVATLEGYDPLSKRYIFSCENNSGNAAE